MSLYYQVSRMDVKIITKNKQLTKSHEFQANLLNFPWELVDACGCHYNIHAEKIPVFLQPND